MKRNRFKEGAITYLRSEGYLQNELQLLPHELQLLPCQK